MLNKKVLSGLVGALVIASGCATVTPVGGLLTEITLPVSVTANGSGNKKGVATCKSILTLLATGDCSLETAKKNGGITEVTHVDWKTNNILGVIGNYELIVYGK